MTESQGRATNALGHDGFTYASSPQLFHSLEGTGPLIVLPDTSVLIDLVQGGGDALDELGTVLTDPDGIVFGPVLDGAWGDRRAAIDDVIRLWFWRDIRFYISPIYQRDSNKPLDDRRMQERQRVVDAMAQDFWSRGGFDQHSADDDALSARAMRGRTPGGTMSLLEHRRWPSGERDALLLREAIEVGCHVFLTEDKGILGCAETGRAYGLAVLRPAQMLELLDQAGELSTTQAPLLPDLMCMSRYLEMFDT